MKTYLGRPWRAYSAVTFLLTEMSDVVRPEGWQNWNLPEREKTSRFAEYASTGEGARPGARVAWSKQLDEAAAKRLAPAVVLAGHDGWNPLGAAVRVP